MAVTLNAAGSELHTAAATSINYTGLTVAAGANTAIVGLLFVDSNTNISGITATWDSGGASQAMTQIITKDASGQKAVYIFGLAGEHGAVATGNKTLNVSWTGSQATFFVAMAFDGVNQTGSTTSFYNSASATTATVTITSNTGDIVIALESSGGSQGTSTGTQIFNDHTLGAIINAMCQYAAGAASVAIGNNGTNACIAGVSILAAPTPGTGPSAGRNSGILQAYSGGLKLGSLPRGLPKIDWSHPLANGLIAAYLPGISEGINLTGMGGNLSRVTPANIAALSLEGPGIKTATAADGFKGLAPPAFLGPNNSYYWRGVYTSSVSNLVLFGIQYSDPEAAPYLFESINCSGTNTNLQLLWNIGGGFTSGTAVAFPTGVMMSALGTFNVNSPGNNAVLYKNGIAVATTGMGATVSSSATSTICFHMSTAATSRDLVAIGNVGYIWNRPLSADEAVALDADPYAFLIPAEGEMPALNSISAAPTPPYITSIYGGGQGQVEMIGY